ncbi:alpha/beta hydrolase family protein [Brevundimonas sp. FT23028]|uniref:alpha/beta hydrolase family protein n=1 Tax=Brevundimonas sp. FT23028 TaxID=3393748 RepID=UPI003B588D9C
MIRRVASALVLVVSLGLAPVAPAFAQQAPAPVTSTAATAATHVELAAPDGRTIDVSVWQAANEQAVIVFGHGWGNFPASYSRIIDYWVAQGFTVVAPMHTDSLRHPQHAEATPQSIFISRIVDLEVVRGYVKASHPGKPMVAAGHSFGSLNALMEAGAVTPAGPMADDEIKAVVAFSSPGLIPQVVTPSTFATVTAPVLMVTGDADLVRGFVTDPRDHRAPFDASPAGDKMLMTFAGGDHSLIGNADADDFALIATTATDFIRAHALGDSAARARLDALTAPEGVTIERR